MVRSIRCITACRALARRLCFPFLLPLTPSCLPPDQLDNDTPSLPHSSFVSLCSTSVCLPSRLVYFSILAFPSLFPLTVAFYNALHVLSERKKEKELQSERLIYFYTQKIVITLHKKGCVESNFRARMHSTFIIQRIDTTSDYKLLIVFVHEFHLFCFVLPLVYGRDHTSSSSPWSNICSIVRYRIRCIESFGIVKAIPL